MNVLALVVALLAPAPPAASIPILTAEPSKKVCVVSHSKEVRYRPFGYDHIVHISNGCDVTVACRIRASSRSGEMQVDVPAHKRVSVTVKTGSPAREFSVAVYCEAKED
jgi:hypothetical protein